MGFQQSPNDPTWPNFSDKHPFKRHGGRRHKPFHHIQPMLPPPCLAVSLDFRHTLPLNPTLHFCGKVYFLGPLLGNLNRPVVLSFSNQPGVQWDR